MPPDLTDIQFIFAIFVMPIPFSADFKHRLDMDRREFLKDSALIAAGAVTVGALSSCGNLSAAQALGATGEKGAKSGAAGRKGRIQLEWDNFTAQMKYTFSISGSSRNSTPIVLTRLNCCGITGYGEASMPPYLGESHASVDAFLLRVRDEVLPRFDDAFLLEDILAAVDALSGHDCAAKASVDIALHDLLGKIMGQPWWKIWGYNSSATPYTCYTIGFDASDEIVRKKTSEAMWSHFLKVKLGQNDQQDRRMIRLIREVDPAVPLFSATVYPGSSGIVDVEREVSLGQPIHSKGVMILTGYLGSRYAQEFPLAISASIALEQSYGYVDGDSASLGEVCTLLSALSRTPLKQCFAITGSINQFGEVQAVGGVNEKIEGFFRLCEARGLTGEQGVIIPWANVCNLMLDTRVIHAVRAGLFNVYAVRTVDEALGVLVGEHAGSADACGV